jgi:hypothetical protein
VSSSQFVALDAAAAAATTASHPIPLAFLIVFLTSTPHNALAMRDEKRTWKKKDDDDTLMSQSKGNMSFSRGQIGYSISTTLGFQLHRST